jgi:hypothetical protein
VSEARRTHAVTGCGEDGRSYLGQFAGIGKNHVALPPQQRSRDMTYVLVVGEADELSWLVQSWLFEEVLLTMADALMESCPKWASHMREECELRFGYYFLTEWPLEAFRQFVITYRTIRKEMTERMLQKIEDVKYHPGICSGLQDLGDVLERALVDREAGAAAQKPEDSG